MSLSKISYGLHSIDEVVVRAHSTRARKFKNCQNIQFMVITTNDFMGFDESHFKFIRKLLPCLSHAFFVFNTKIAIFFLSSEECLLR